MTILIPNTFADKTGVVRLQDLDENFTSVVSGVNTEVTNIQGQVDAVEETVNTEVTNIQGQVDAIEQTVNNIEDPVAMGLVFGPDAAPQVEPGSVVQFINSLVATQSSVSIPASYTTFTDVPGISLAITPKFANSKILIQIRWFGEVNSGWEGMFGIKRNGTAIGFVASSGSAQGISMPMLSYMNDNNSTPEMAWIDYVDSPNSTSAVTYNLCFCSTSALTLWTNRCFNASSGTGVFEISNSSIMLWEIAQ